MDLISNNMEGKPRASTGEDFAVCVKGWYLIFLSFSTLNLLSVIDRAKIIKNLKNE
jgi:hypothetical protein